MVFSEEIFSLKNGRGELMYGIIHHPPKPNGALVVMFNIGLHYRVCHSRLFVRQARELQQEGFTVVRLDTSKVGYSHGEIPVGRAIDSYDAVQTGLFVDDALIFLQHLREKLRPTKVLCTGLCGGALTAIITAARDMNVDGVVFIAGPVTVTSAEYELSTLHPFHADIMVAGYMKRLLRPEAWLRFFSGRTSYRDLLRSLKVKLTHKLRPRRQKTKSEYDDVLEPEEDKGNRFNRVFYESFDSLVRSGKHILFLMPELDHATYDFDNVFAKPVLRQYAEFTGYYSVARIPKANHTFSTPISTRQLFDTTAQWLKKRLE
jgi:pimeloyl-ACP methyl ester carboxylesterase